MTFDEARANYPAFQFAVHAYEPGGNVTLEMINDGQSFVFEGPTLQAALDRAFPPEEPVAEAANVFD